MKKFLSLLVIMAVLTPFVFAQEEEEERNKYTADQNSYIRSHTAEANKYDQQIRIRYQRNIEEYEENITQYQETGDEQYIKKATSLLNERNSILSSYLKNKAFLPTYDELIGKGRGISVDDWKMYLFTEAAFESLVYELDTDGDKILSKEELDKHPLMGSAQKHTQTVEAAYDLCKDIDDYKKKLGKYQEVEVYTPSSYSNEQAQKVGSKTYITTNKYEKKVVAKKVPLGEYAALMLRDQEEQDSFLPFLPGLILVFLLAGGTLLITKLVK